MLSMTKEVTTAPSLSSQGPLSSPAPAPAENDENN